MGRIKVKPHSLELSALESTENTLKSVPGGGLFVRNVEDAYEVDGDGFLTLQCEDPEFMLFAVVKQGWVKEAKQAGILVHDLG